MLQRRILPGRPREGLSHRRNRGTDNHCGWPGRAFADCEGPGRHPAWSEIVTGVWTPALRRREVYESLFARHTWAVWDTRALVEFRVGGVLMGGELQVAPGEKLQATIRISAQSALRTVEIVSEGAIVWQQSSTSPDLTVTAELGPVTGSTHFYLRALEHAGGIIYASPVFVALRAGRESVPPILGRGASEPLSAAASQRHNPLSP